MLPAARKKKNKKMTSVCISSGCVDARAPMRATYVNLYKWPESDAEFVRSVSRGGCPRVVDSYSCRQMYLRSYTFSRKQTVHEKTRKCLGRVKEKVVVHHGRKGEVKKSGGGNGRKCGVMRKVKDLSCAIFHRLLSCSAAVDVVDGRKS